MMKRTDVSVIRAVKDDLIACGDTASQLQDPHVQCDIEEEGDFPMTDEVKEESTFLEMSSAETQAAHARACILQGYTPSALPGEVARLTRRQHVLATEQLDPPMTDEERRDLNDRFLIEDDNTWLEQEADKSEAWNQRRELLSNPSL